MDYPKFRIGDSVHINETSGVGRVIYIECIARKYIYTVQYRDGKKKTAQETDLIKVS